MTTMEHNYQTLRHAIDRLPMHEPDSGVWNAIDRQLGNAETLNQAISELPTYAPPVAVWERIAEDLEKPAKMRRLRPVWLATAAAAVAVFAVGIYFWKVESTAPVEKIQVVYTETAQPEQQLKADWDEDEADIQMVMKAYAKQASFLQKDQSLLSELEELNQAKEEIKMMLSKYGKDPDLIRSMGTIERQRSAVIKQMVTEI